MGLEAYRAVTHARGGSHGGQCRRQGCYDDAQRNLNKLRFQLHDKKLKIQLSKVL